MKRFSLLSAFFIVGQFLFAQETAVRIDQQIPETVNAGSEITIEVKIEKGNLQGFGKLQQPIPDGFTLGQVNATGGSHSLNEGELKIIWVNVPTESNFTVSYTLTVPGDKGAIVHLGGGKFSYLEENTRKTIDIMHKEVTISNATGAEVSNTPVARSGNTSSATTNTVPRTTTPVATSNSSYTSSTPKPAPVAKATPVNSSSSNSTVPVSIPAPRPKAKTVAGSDEVIFKVQIGAFKGDVSKDQFRNIPQLAITSEDGMSKAYSGSFKTLAEAETRLQSMKGRGYQSAFVAAFKNGKRITIEEATGAPSEETTNTETPIE